MSTTFMTPANLISVHLAEDISDSDLEFDVATGEGATLPAEPFPLFIDSEIVLVTNVSTDTLTVTRAQESTVAVVHYNGTTAYLNISAKYVSDLNTAVNTLEGYYSTGVLTVEHGGSGAATLTGILVGNGTSAFTAITDSHTNWDTAYTDRMKWDGGSTGLVSATARDSLGLDADDTVTFGTLGVGKNGADGVAGTITMRDGANPGAETVLDYTDVGFLNTIAGLAKTDGGVIVGDGSTFVLETGDTLRTSLGLAIGTNVQAYNAGLADIAGLAKTDGNFIVGDGSNWVAETGATVRTSLGLGNVENTALSTWAGTTNVTTLGTIATGTWNAGAVTSSGNILGNNGSIAAVKDGSYSILSTTTYRANANMNYVFGYGARGSQASPGQVQANDLPLTVRAFACDNGGTPTFQQIAQIVFQAAENTTAASSAGNVIISVTPSGSITSASALTILSTKYIAAPGIYNQTSASAANVVVDASGNVMRSTSSARYKTAIEPIADEGDVLHLVPKKFKSTKDLARVRSNKERAFQQATEYLERARENGNAEDIARGEAELAKAQAALLEVDDIPEQYGLIAEDVAAIDPKLATYDANGLPEAVDWNAVNTLLLKKVKGQADIISDLVDRVEKLEKT